MSKDHRGGPCKDRGPLRRRGSGEAHKAKIAGEQPQAELGGRRGTLESENRTSHERRLLLFLS